MATVMVCFLSHFNPYTWWDLFLLFHVLALIRLGGMFLDNSTGLMDTPDTTGGRFVFWTCPLGWISAGGNFYIRWIGNLLVHGIFVVVFCFLVLVLDPMSDSYGRNIAHLM